MSDTNARSYWKANLKIVGTLLCIWFFISFVCGILIVDFLDNFRIGGFKLGIFVYIRQMDKLDHQYNLDQVSKTDTLPRKSATSVEQEPQS